MLLLPNTDYTEKKRDHGIVSVRGDNDDFEYVLRNNTVGFAENKEMQRFLLWARVMAEMAVLRFAWIGLRELAGITQSRVLRNLAGWIEHGGDPAAEPLRAAMGGAIGGAGDLVTAITYLYTDPESKRMLELWWARSMRPLLQDQVRPVLDEVFRFDLLTQPVCVGPDGKLPGDLAISTVDGEEYYLREGVRLRYDVPAIVARLRAGQPADLAPRDTNLDLYYRIGAESAVRSTNHESIVHYMGMTRDQVMTRPADGDGLAGSLLGNRGGCS
jgi:hypothetical protein